MTTETETKPVVSDAPPAWPPLAHIIRKKDEPVKPGTIAICGAKLMGIELGPIYSNAIRCKKCDEIARRESEH